MRILPSVFFGLMASTAVAESPKVVSDIAPVHSLVAQVMEGVATPDLLVDPGASPHGYQLRPSQARALQQADLVFWVGEPLTPWLDHVIEDIAADAEAIALLDAPGTQLLESRDVAVFAHDHDDHEDHEEHGHEEHADHDDHDHDKEHGHEEHADHDDHDHDKEHGHDEHADHDDHHDEHGLDAHAWLDPENAKVWLQEIATHLAEVDPENAVTYQANATRAIETLNMQLAEVNAALAPVQGKTFIVFHDAYQYFETRFDLLATGAIRLGDATTPSAARLVELQAEMKEANVVCAFSEPQFDDGLIDAIAGDGINKGVLDANGAKFETGPDLYGQVIGDLTAAFTTCLK